MATYSTNQNRQFYVAKGYKAANADLANPGDIKVKTIGEGNCKEFYFLYMNPDGEVIKSDRIPVKNLDYVKAISSSEMLVPLKSLKVTLNADCNGGTPILGQDYVLRIEFNHFFGISEYDKYYKDAAVHVTSAMVADDKKFYKAMVAALNKAFSRELGATKDTNPYLEFSAGTSGSEDGIYITAKEQPWTLGVETQEDVDFTILETTVLKDGDDLVWLTVTDTTPAKYVEDNGDMVINTDLVAGTNAVGNGKRIADLEYFCMGERGDQYRNVGWPNVVPTKYMVDATTEYHVLEFHFAFTDTGVNSYRSEKDITIVAATANKAALNSLIDDVETATGLTITGIS